MAQRTRSMRLTQGSNHPPAPGGKPARPARAFAHGGAALAVLALLAGAAAAAAAGDWPQFRGPHRDGVSPEGHLLRSWPAGGPRRLWQVPIGEGYSHLTVAGGRIYTLFGANGAENLAAYDAGSGRQLWVTRIDSELINDQGNGPRSTPTFDAGTLYVQSAQGQLDAVNAATGKVLWHHDLRGEFGTAIPTWGSASSPLVEGDLLLVAAGGGRGHAAMAFDKRSGRVVWTALDDKPGYAAPIAITAAGVRQAVFFTGGLVAGLAAADGRVLWRVPWQTDYDVNAATPLFIAPDELFVSSGYDTGAAVFRIGGDPRHVTVEPVWKSRVLKNQFSSTVLGGDYLYGFDNGTFKCVNARSGEERWKHRGLGHGSVILADAMLLVLSESGKLALVEATPEDYRERAGFQALNGRCWTAPSLADGKLYLRNGEVMEAFDVAAGRS
jgi:outer membrane protein assembly factor BamB